MRSCKEIAELHARASEKKIPLRARLELTMHHWMCKMCRGFLRDMSLIRRVLRDFDSETGVSADEKLSPESRERIRAEIERQMDE